MANAWCACSAAWAASTGPTSITLTTSFHPRRHTVSPANPSRATGSLHRAGARVKARPSGWCRISPCRGRWWPSCVMWTLGGTAMGSITIRPCTASEVINSPEFPALRAEYAAESAVRGLPDPAERRPCISSWKQTEPSSFLARSWALSWWAL